MILRGQIRGPLIVGDRGGDGSASALHSAILLTVGDFSNRIDRIWGDYPDWRLLTTRMNLTIIVRRLFGCAEPPLFPRCVCHAYRVGGEACRLCGSGGRFHGKEF